MTTTVLLRSGIFAGPLFVAVFLIEGFRRPDYDPLRHPVSSLALGEAGWVQTADFLLAGSLTVAFALGAHRALRRHETKTWGPSLIAIWGAGLLGAGAFLTDPVGGYPPGTPAVPVHASTLGTLHDLLSLIGFAALVAACAAFARWFLRWHRRAWAAYSAATGAAFVIFVLLATGGLAQTEPLAAVGGLLQRTAVVIGWAWITALAVHLLRRTHDDAGG
ncbi:DUF998 domain-containing protein [Streptomonospora arabica]|uniref:DUF998 domain-containing protein n=1 Tax=Streptomonospora arabica TaxID=412417 RepID=A0ABV9ST60_9ACTN